MSVNDILTNITDDLCSNWWPSSNHPNLIKNKIDEGIHMPHPMCSICANWLPDIEDLGVIIKCSNNWSKEKNTKK